jgi:cytochrome P450/NADPH-cytochrome P450 reductase
MIGPGTGLAPFRAFLQERALLAAAGKKLGPAMLFFGCRHPDQDFLYRQELEDMAAKGLAELHVAFSRHDGEKTYVQDLLRKNSKRVWELIEAGAHVYVCGDGSRMEPDVKRALAVLYAEEKDADPAEADAWIEQMGRENRYVLDVWAGN